MDRITVKRAGKGLCTIGAALFLGGSFTAMGLRPALLRRLLLAMYCRCYRSTARPATGRAHCLIESFANGGFTLYLQGFREVQGILFPGFEVVDDGLGRAVFLVVADRCSSSSPLSR
jgi:hypothetical protein